MAWRQSPKRLVKKVPHRSAVDSHRIVIQQSREANLTQLRGKRCSSRRLSATASAQAKGNAAYADGSVLHQSLARQVRN